MKRIAALLPLTLAACGGSAIAFPPDGGEWPAAPVPSWSAQPRLVVPDIADDTLAFVSVDLPTPHLYALAPVGDIPVEIEGPHDVAGSADGSLLYVVLSNYAPQSGTGPHGAHGLGTVPSSLIKLRALDLVKLGEVQLAKNAAEMLLSDDGRTAYVSHFDLLTLQTQVAKGLPAADGLSSIAIVDTATMQRELIPVCPTTHDLELSADGKTLYATCSESDEIAIIDLPTRAVRRVAVGPAPGAILHPAYYPYAILRAPADGSLWISCNVSGDLRVYDPVSGQMDPARTVFLNGVPMFGAFLSDGKTLVMPHQGDDRISIVDTSISKEVDHIALPAGVCLNVRNTQLLDDHTAWVTCEGDHVTRPGSVVALDLNAHVALGAVEVGLFPNAMTLLPPAPPNGM